MFNPARALIGLCLSHGAGFFKKTTMERKKLFESTEDCKKAMETISAYEDLVDRFKDAGFDYMIFCENSAEEVTNFLSAFVEGYSSALEEVKR